MRVIYRITDIPSTNPSPIFPHDKYRLNKFCLKSFLKAFEGVDIDMTFLCDFCSFETIAMIRDLVPDSEVIETSIGINETMLKAYELAYNQDDDILFQECDYYWLPNTGSIFREALKNIPLISPYDHLNFYIDDNIHSPVVKLFVLNNHHWRSTERNTMTFAIQNEVFKENYEVFKKYGYLDNDVWHELKVEGHTLFTPLPTFATHMVTNYLSPSIDWHSLWKTQT